MITRQELKKLLTIGDEENLEGGQDWKRAWDKLDLCFQRKRDLKFYPAILQALYEEAFRQCCENNILLLEIRGGFKDTVEKNTAVHASLREAYYRVRADYPDFRVRIIAAAGKRKDISVEETCDQLRTAIAMRDTFLDEFDPENPEPMIIGLDLINEEDNSLALKEYTKFLYSDEVTDSGLNLFLHCGESLQMDNDSVVDAYLLSALRAGYAFNLFRFPLMMQKYAEEEIAVEICPISNYRLQYVEDLRLHPGLTYLNSGIPGCICSDDGLFMTEHPLVDDFYAVVMNWNLSLADLKVLCRNSILYSGLSMEEITQLLSAWETQWDEFIAVEQKQADRLIEAGVLETETNDTAGDNAA